MCRLETGRYPQILHTRALVNDVKSWIFYVLSAPYRSNIYTLLHPWCSFNERGIILLHKDERGRPGDGSRQRRVRWDRRKRRAKAVRRVHRGSGFARQISWWGSVFRVQAALTSPATSCCSHTHTHTHTLGLRSALELFVCRGGTSQLLRTRHSQKNSKASHVWLPGGQQGPGTAQQKHLSHVRKALFVGWSWIQMLKLVSGGPAVNVPDPLVPSFKPERVGVATMILKRLIPLSRDRSEAGTRTCAPTFSSRLRLPPRQLFLFELEKVERHSPSPPPPPPPLHLLHSSFSLQPFIPSCRGVAGHLISPRLSRYRFIEMIKSVWRPPALMAGWGGAVCLATLAALITKYESAGKGGCWLRLSETAFLLF